MKGKTLTTALKVGLIIVTLTAGMATASEEADQPLMPQVSASSMPPMGVILCCRPCEPPPPSPPGPPDELPGTVFFSVPGRFHVSTADDPVWGRALYWSGQVRMGQCDDSGRCSLGPWTELTAAAIDPTRIRRIWTEVTVQAPPGPWGEFSPPAISLAEYRFGAEPAGRILSRAEILPPRGWGPQHFRAGSNLGLSEDLRASEVPLPAPLGAGVTVRTVTDLEIGLYRAWVWSSSTIGWYGGREIRLPADYEIDRSYLLAIFGPAPPGWIWSDLTVTVCHRI